MILRISGLVMLGMALASATHLTYGASADENVCYKSYKDNLANVEISRRTLNEEADAFSKYCDKSGAVNKSSLGVKGTSQFEEFPFSVDYSQASDDEKFDQFCKIGSSHNGYKEDQTEYSRTIQVDAENSLNACLQIAQSGLLLTHTYNPPKQIVIEGHLNQENIKGPQAAALLEALTYTPKVVTCTSNSFSPPQKFPAKSEIKIQHSFSIECVRNADKTPSAQVKSGEEYFPPVQITASILAPGVHKPYVINLPAERSFGPTLSSEYQARIDEANAKIASVSADLATTTAKLNQTSTSLANAHVTGVSMWYRTERQSYPSGFHWLSCNPVDINNIAASQCPAPLSSASYLLITSPAGTGAGESCGFALWAVACLSKQ